MASRTLFLAFSRNRGFLNQSFKSIPVFNEANVSNYCSCGALRSESFDESVNSEEFNDLKSRIFHLRLPKRSAVRVLERWTSEGNQVTITELRNISKELRKIQRYKHALEILEWMVTHNKSELSDSEFAIRIDLMTKVFGVDAAERYFEGLPIDAKTCETYTALLHSFAGSKLTDRAETLYEKIKESDIPLTALPFNEMMTLYMSIGQVEKVSSIVNDLKQRMIHPDIFTYNLWINSLAATLNIDGVKQILNEMNHNPNSNENWVRYIELVNIYVKSANLLHSRSNSVVKSVSGISPSSFSFNNVLFLLAKSRKLDRTWWFFTEYLGRTRLDVYSFEITIKALCENGNISEGFELLVQMEMMGMSPNVLIFTILIEACCRNGDIDQAKVLFFKMDDLGLAANQYIYTVMINGFFRKGYKKDGFELYEKMKLVGVLPNLYTYNSLITEYCRDGKLSLAFKLFDEISKRGVACNEVTYNILIGGLCRKGQVSKAERLLEQMKRARINPTTRTFNLLMDGLCNTGQLNKALSYLDKLKLIGFSPTLVTYNILISGFSKVGNPLVVLELVKEMEDRGISPSKVTYTILMDAFVRSDDIEKAYEMFHLIKRTGLVPDQHTYGVLIHGLCIKGNMVEASKLYKSMVEMHLQPNDVIYNTMINGYCKECNSYKALKFLEEMVKNGATPNVASYISTIQVLCKEGKSIEAKRLLKEMIEAGLKPSESLCSKIS